jgi:hypothetical protein
VYLLAQLLGSDTSLDGQTAIEILLDLDDVLETPNYEFTLQSIKVFDREQKSLTINFFFDFASALTSGLAKQRFLRLNGSGVEYAIASWFPPLSKQGIFQHIAVRNTQNETTLTLTF